MTKFDIVILVGPSDASIIKEQIVYTKKNIIDYRKIYLICSNPSISIEGCITIDERIFPFSIDTVAEIHGKNSRNGWFLQQLIKLYAGQCLPEILETYLIIDCDTFFIRPTHFIEDGKCMYNYGTEYHLPYFEHMRRMNSSFEKMDQDKSGICHHMMFERKYINEIMELIRQEHQQPFWRVFLEKVDDHQRTGSGGSEYEIYFNYMLKNHRDKIIVRHLPWNNFVTSIDNINTEEMQRQYAYVSWHHYRRSS